VFGYAPDAILRESLCEKNQSWAISGVACLGTFNGEANHTPNGSNPARAQVFFMVLPRARRDFRPTGPIRAYALSPFRPFADSPFHPAAVTQDH
jgi:hypothetical protein